MTLDKELKDRFPKYGVNEIWSYLYHRDHCKVSEVEKGMWNGKFWKIDLFGAIEQNINIDDPLSPFLNPFPANLLFN